MNFIKEFINTIFKDSIKYLLCIAVSLILWIYGMDLWNIFIDPWCPPQISAPLAIIFVIFICPFVAFVLISKTIDYFKSK